MSAHEANYSIRMAYPDYLERARAQTVSCPVYLSGALVAPSAGTVVFYSPTGAELASGSVTITASVATFALAAVDLPATLALGKGYYFVWSLTLGGIGRAFRRDASVVLHAAVPTLTDADLTAVYSDLTRQLASGTTTFESYIQEAWKRIVGRLEGQGVYPDHIVTYWSLREVHVELAYHLIALDFGSSQGGRWLDLAEKHKKEFELAWGRLRFEKADTSAITPANKGVTFMNASPRASWKGFGGL